MVLCREVEETHIFTEFLPWKEGRGGEHGDLYSGEKEDLSSTRGGNAHSSLDRGGRNELNFMVFFNPESLISEEGGRGSRKVENLRGGERERKLKGATAPYPVPNKRVYSFPSSEAWSWGGEKGGEIPLAIGGAFGYLFLRREEERKVGLFYHEKGRRKEAFYSLKFENATFTFEEMERKRGNRELPFRAKKRYLLCITGGASTLSRRG